MQKNNIYILVYTVFFLFNAFNTACSQTTWTKLEYYFNVGSLPPPYHYNYTITISDEGIAELDYVAGYTKTDKNNYKYTVDIDKDIFKNLNSEIKRSDILNIKINQRPNNEIPDGGHSDNLQIYYGDKLITSVPSYPDSDNEKVLTKLYKAIVKCLPDNIWKEIESKKTADGMD